MYLLDGFHDLEINVEVLFVGLESAVERLSSYHIQLCQQTLPQMRVRICRCNVPFVDARALSLIRYLIVRISPQFMTSFITSNICLLAREENLNPWIL
jgi:hypothetical protein